MTPVDTLVVSPCSTPWLELEDCLAAYAKLGFAKFEAFTSWCKSAFDIDGDPADYRDRLAELGIDVTLDEIVLSTDGLAAYLRSRGVHEVYLLGTEAMRRHLEHLDIRHTTDHPAYVVVGYDTEMTYEKLADACIWINQGVPYVASHPDLTCPTGLGPIPDIGSITALLEITTGVAPSKVFGKPNASTLGHLIRDPDRAVMIGDRLYTDKALADECGIDFVCTLSGETTRHDIENLSIEDWPTLVIPTLEALLR